MRSTPHYHIMADSLVNYLTRVSLKGLGLLRKARLIGSSPLAMVLIQVLLNSGVKAATTTVVLLAEYGLVLSTEQAE